MLITDFILIFVAVLYLLIVGILFIYGLNFFYLTYLSWRAGGHTEMIPAIDEWPSVTIQLPIYNERYVAQRLIEAILKLEYPQDLLEIQVLDDSTDDTVEIIRYIVDDAFNRGINITHIHRIERNGFKAGALAEGMARANGQYLAIFDADFIPQSDFLIRTIPYFYKNNQDDPRPIAFLQTRWGHINQDYSILTMLQSLAIDAHFMVEQFARSRFGYWFNFNGTAGIWRREAIEAAGGWKADTLTEDLDLSYRAYLNGWRALYLRDVAVPAELPVSFNAYRKQQHRWARGSLECALKMTPQIWKAPIPIKQKVEATLHLTGYGVHLLLFTSMLLYPMVILLYQRYPSLVSLFGIAFLFNITAFAPTVFFVIAQQQLGKKWWRRLPIIFFTSAVGAGMMVNTVRAAWQIITRKTEKFERTPKFGIARRGQNWKANLYQLQLDPLVFAELTLAGMNGITAIAGIITGNWVIAIYAIIFGAGLMFVSGMTIAQTISVQLNRQQVKVN